VTTRRSSRAATKDAARQPAARAVPVDPGRASPAARLRASIGNQAMLRRLESQRGDRREQAADLLGREARQGAPTPLLDSAGGALSSAARAFFELRLGRGLGRVRFHRDWRAQQAAAKLDARAFTTGKDIFLGRDEGSSDSPRGRALIAHELAHVAQQAAGAAPALQRQALPLRPQPSDASPGLLTNDALLIGLRTESDWLHRHVAADSGYAAHRARARALEAERSARVQSGAVWLDEPPSSQPLFGLIAYGDGLVVVEDPASRSATGATASGLVLTRSQLDRMLLDLSVRTFPATPAMGAAVTGATLGTGLYTAGDYRGYAPLFAERVNPDTLRTAFPGNAGEYFYGARTPDASGRTDLNTRAWQRPRPTPGNPGLLGWRSTDFPVFDFMERGNELISVKQSLGLTQADRFNYFDSGLSDIHGRSAPTTSGFTTFDQAVFNLAAPGSLRWPPNSPALSPAERAAWEVARTRTLQRARLAVNPEDVVQYRADVARRIQRGSSTAYARVIDAYLAAQPEVHNGTTYTTLAQINAASAGDRATLMGRVATRIASTQIVPGAVTRQSTGGLARVRTNMGLDVSGQGSAPRPDVQARAFPEALAVGEYGYRGAMARTVAPGALMGGGAAVATTIIVNGIRYQQLPSGEVIAVSGAAGTLGGAMGAPLETAVQARLAQTAMARTLTAGGTAIARGSGASLLRGLGGAGAAAPVAGLITLGTMGYYDATDPFYNPAALDYLGGGGRAFVVGGVSGLAASALTFAMFGATLGPLGFVVGLLLGVGLYLLTDYLIGARTERAIRFVGEPVLGPAQYPIIP